ncbi:hypothetical protein C1Y30_31420, partial [Pseudomonas sp. GW704-F3]|uniref:hypothetical protein n=1 Tax=Pseudomonas sp. GW704-F3 TaxID=2070574 RepID=UPI000CB298F3
MRTLILALGAACATVTLASWAQAASKAAPAQVVAAERAFAADGLTLGVRDSFLKHSAPEAVVLSPEPTLAHAVYESAPPSKAKLV